jgi:uncharacterized protein (DUF4415 family)
MRQNEKHITRVTRDEARHLKDETDYARLDALTDDDIAKAVADDPDAAPIDVDWTKARLVIPPGKDIITLRLDRDVLDWLRAQGKGYQTLINQVLRAFYEAKRSPLLTEVDDALKAATRIDPHVEKALRKAGVGTVKTKSAKKSTTPGRVYIEARPKGRQGSAIEGYVVEQGDRVLKTFKTQEEAITWAKSEGHSPHVARDQVAKPAPAKKRA